MKKLVLATAMAFTLLAMHAEIPSMVFKTTDGESHIIAAKDLAISFADGKMKAVSGTQSLELPVASLVSMEFNGVVSVFDTAIAADGAVTVTNLAGVACGEYASLARARQNLPNGIYIVTDKAGNSFKISLKK